MASIGSLVFCTSCGNLLPETEGLQNALLKCHVCHTLCQDTSSQTIITHSKPSAYPSTLRSKHSDVQQTTAADRVTLATIQQTCEKCGREEVRWHEQQLRSADEGSTIFYVCECGNKYVLVLYLKPIQANRPRWTQNN
jgi:DNA-directed RNA polymerase I subunit RPA12